VIDMGSEKEISQCSVEFLQDTRSWILFPTRVGVFFFKRLGPFFFSAIVTNAISANDYNPQLQSVTSTLPRQKVRYVKSKPLILASFLNGI